MAPLFDQDSTTPTPTDLDLQLSLSPMGSPHHPSLNPMHAHATLPSPRPPTPSRPSQPIDELPLHQNYQQWGSDLCSNSYPSMDTVCLEPNDQNSQFTTLARLIHSPPSQEEFQGTCTSPASFTLDCSISASRELSPLFYWSTCKKKSLFY